MYSDLYQMLSLLLPGGREIRGYVRQLERTQWFSASEREAWQLARIQALVKHAYTHVPFYQELYREAGAHPEDIQTLQDFRALPFVTRADVKNNLDRLVVPHWDGKLDRSETGGSTGTPMQFYVEDAFWRWNIALEARGRRWYGVQVGDKMAWVWGAPRDIPLRDWRKRLRALVRRQRFLNAFMLSEAKMLAFAKMLAEWKPTIIRGYPAALTPFANIVEETGITGIRPRVIETSGEKGISVSGCRPLWLARARRHCLAMPDRKPTRQRDPLHGNCGRWRDGWARQIGGDCRDLVYP
jgi:phenylacetate-coenzyme A ligase PaaK-like adenylate-forming protein